MFNIFKKSSNKNKKNSSKYLVVPDLHGTYSIYKQVEKIIKEEIEEDRTIIFLGDYGDRGESGEVYGKEFKDVGSYFVLRDLIELKEWAKQNDRKIIFLKGNHEIFFMKYFINEDLYPYKQYDFFKDSADCINYVFRYDHSFEDKLINFLRELTPYYHDKKLGYLFVHAGIDPDEKNIEKQANSGIIYWIRDKFIFCEKKLDFTVIFGHTPFSKPFMKSDKIGLDSGVYKREFLNLLKINGENSTISQIHKKELCTRGC